MGSSAVALLAGISFISKLLYVLPPTQRFSARASQLIKCQGFPQPKNVGNTTIDKARLVQPK